MKREDNWNIDIGKPNRELLSDLKDALGAKSYAEFIIPALREKYPELIAVNEQRKRLAAAAKNGATA